MSSPLLITLSDDDTFYPHNLKVATPTLESFAPTGTFNFLLARFSPNPADVPPQDGILRGALFGPRMLAPSSLHAGKV